MQEPCPRGLGLRTMAGVPRGAGTCAPWAQDDCTTKSSDPGGTVLAERQNTDERNEIGGSKMHPECMVNYSHKGAKTI